MVSPMIQTCLGAMVMVGCIFGDAAVPGDLGVVHHDWLGDPGCFGCGLFIHLNDCLLSPEHLKRRPKKETCRLCPWETVRGTSCFSVVCM